MSKATIYFSDKTSLVLHEDDLITPIVLNNSGEDTYASMDKTVKVEYHVHNGLIPSIMDALCKCSLFYVNQEIDITYSSHANVRIEMS